jgi:uncharacterized protein (UPF0333 family)
MNRRLIIIAILLAAGAGVYFYIHKSADNVQIQSTQYECVTGEPRNKNLTAITYVSSCKKCPSYDNKLTGAYQYCKRTE